MGIKQQRLHAFLQRLQYAYEKNPKAKEALDKMEHHVTKKQATAAILEAETLIQALFDH